uniref:DUF2786 domain-containing protein n=1 Tax=Mycena chlorophos TaxID=658473 RepID=A0ABQ0LZ38_MYCCL|nr:predicted protein [Mycena chlorophos]
MNSSLKRPFHWFNGDSDDSEPDTITPLAKAKRVRRKKLDGPSTKAQVTVLATDTTPDEAAARDRISNMRKEVLDRIRKALALASHEGTGEQEAKAALRKATKLLDQHSVTQADILAHETEAEKLKRAGQSVVSVRNTISEDKPVPQFGWTRSLACAVDTFFNCQHYTTKFKTMRPKIEWTFYGLAEQTVAAAQAFEMCYNLILNWSLDVGPGVNVKKQDSCSSQNAALISFQLLLHRHCAWQVFSSLISAKQQTFKKELALLKQRQEQEAAEDKSRLERLRELPAPDVKAEIKEEEKPAVLDRRVKVEEVEDEDSFKPLSSPESPSIADPSPFVVSGNSFLPFEPSPFAAQFNNYGRDYDDDNEPYIPPVTVEDADFDAADTLDDFDVDAELEKAKARTAMPPPPPPAPRKASTPPPLVPKKEEDDDESPWTSVQQLVQFRETSIAIGDDFIKKQGIKLVTAKKRKPLEFKDPRSASSYLQGREDARSIDVHGRRKITDGN